jgi:hypothetical protein
MENDDIVLNYINYGNITTSGDLDDGSDYITIDFSDRANTIDINSWTAISPSGVTYDTTFGLYPDDINREIYTSHEQRCRHEEYPALKKAWDDYLNMYNLTHGEPPIVD